MVKKLGCNIKVTCPLSVIVADGNKLVTTSECKRFKWQFVPRHFSTDVMMLPLGGCDMVLRIQWLETLRDIRFNFQELRMDFKHNNKRVLLMEVPSAPISPILQQVIADYEDVFAIPTELTPKRNHNHIIPLIEGTQPINIRPYRHPSSQKDTIEGMVTIKEKFPIPIVKELIDELHGSQLFTKLDLRSGYHHIKMNEADIAKTTFRTHEGHYELLVMPFGLTNTPSTFQSLMNEVFKQHLRKFVLVFFDDILIYSQTMEDHALHLKIVLEIMRQHQIYAKRSKCVFGTDKVQYLGYVISAKGVATDREKVKAMNEWPIPINLKQLKGFLGLTGLPKSQGKSVILVVVDRLSKYAYFIPPSHPYTDADVAQVFLDSIYKFHGLPNLIVSDKDKIEARVGQVAYRLKLPDSSQIHIVFHISQLKKNRGEVIQSGSLPICNEQCVLKVEPIAIFDMRLAKRENVATVFVLVQLANRSKEDAT
uniref:Reverse transcriptase domain-containing protein n=1 Tax=Tanacetum cinerariifolium TaxID=118510 RepID=A0A6L2KP15_TANCI|nr:hypothetical protein [Tanacetum cinerariifolium]